MTQVSNLSRCCAGVPLDFHWFDGIVRDSTILPIDIAVDLCFESVQKEGRVWNPHTETMARSEFKSRIKRAMLGKLVPAEQVAEVGHDPAIPMFEIRWQHVHITVRDPESGSISHPNAVVRLYFTEPHRYPKYFIGHHVHEKVLDNPDDISKLQTTEILVAKRKFEYGERILWNLPAA